MSPELEHVPVNSSNLRSVGYDPTDQVLEVRFTSGSTYRYAGVPQRVRDELVASKSPGSYFASDIKNAYGWEKVS